MPIPSSHICRRRRRILRRWRRVRLIPCGVCTLLCVVYVLFCVCGVCTVLCVVSKYYPMLCKYHPLSCNYKLSCVLPLSPCAFHTLPFVGWVCPVHMIIFSCIDVNCVFSLRSSLLVPLLYFTNPSKNFQFLN